MNTLSSKDQPSVWLELAAALLVPAAIVGFSRVFINLSPLAPIAAASLMSTVVAVTCRRFRLPLPAAALISLLALALVVINRFAPGTAIVGVIPTGQTFATLNGLIDQLLKDFQQLESPVPGLDPFLAASMIAVWIMAFLTDWGALRLRLAFEPVLPSALLFIFTSIPPISAQQNRMLSSIVYGSAVAMWAVAQRTSSVAGRQGWLRGESRKGATALARSGLAFAAVAVVLGAWVGPMLPGATAEPVYSLASQQDTTRKVISPYVKLYQRIVEQSDVELFQVTAAEPAYWRIAGLDLYEEGIWRLAGDFSREDGKLPSSSPLGGNRRELDQTYQIQSLGAIWLPAAFTPIEIVDSSANTTWHAETSSLTVDGSTPNGDGVSYTIKSSIAGVQATDLANASPSVPSDIAEHYLILPQLPSILGTTAESATVGTTNRYEQMLALQEFFRNEFDYEVVLSNASGDPITQFLTERKGFCQQFAGVFALMARHLGVPARVATGFTWGDKIGTAPDGRDIYQVTGAQAHAWPEVYFDGIGWVPFEPTPGRGIPGAAYTETAPIQASHSQPSLPDEAAIDQATTTTTQPSTPDGAAPQGNSTTTTSTTLPSTTLPEESNNRSFRDIISGLLRMLLYLSPVLLVGAYLIGMPALHQVLRQRRRDSAHSAADRVTVAWTEANETLAFGFGIKRQPAETSNEFAQRLVDRRSAGARPLVELAKLNTKARYNAPGVGPSDVKQAEGLAEAITNEMTERVSWWVRYRRSLDPRRLPGTIKTVGHSPLSRPGGGATPPSAPSHPDPVVPNRERELTRH